MVFFSSLMPSWRVCVVVAVFADLPLGSLDDHDHE